MQEGAMHFTYFSQDPAFDDPESHSFDPSSFKKSREGSSW
jgi:hypothetical protein